MQIDPSIFKAYDIRGLYPDQINRDIVYSIAQAYVKLIQPKTVVVGCDMRLSGEEFKQAIIEGLTDAGVNIVDIGLVSTDTLYFAAATLPVDGGFQVTASHNPKEYGGLKMVREKGRPISGDSGIYEIRDMVANDHWKVEGAQKGRVETKNVTNDYYEHILKPFDVSKIKPLKVVANTNFGMATPAIEQLQKRLPIQFLEVLNGRLDGNFPKGRPDPLVPENRDETIAAIQKLHPDLGVAWDADADRIFFFDEQGVFIPSPYITALLAEYFLQKEPGAKILCNTPDTLMLEQVVTEYGGTLVVNRVGHSFIKERMIKEEGVFCGEHSGHYYFKDNYYLDNGLMPFVAILTLLSQAGKTFSEILQPLRSKYFMTEEFNLKVTNSDLILEKLKEKYSDAKVVDIDRLTLIYPDWRVNIRTSNTEPLLRINMEALSKDLLDEKFKEVMDFIKSI